tara:strand:+ start:605 stop:754 length:150 start_codon:yes stop_codon:yes gene_type:complete
LEIINELKKFTKNKVKINFKERQERDMVKIDANTNKLKKFLNGNQNLIN